MSGMARASAPTAGGFVALHADYLTLRAQAAKGRATRAALVALAARLAEAVRADAEALELPTAAPPPAAHAKAWAGATHPLERVPRADCKGPEEGKPMARVGRRWSHPNDA